MTMVLGALVGDEWRQVPKVHCLAVMDAPGEDGWQNQEVLDAAYRSLKSGKAETVPLVEKKR